jgi:hypothetical protein
MYDAYGKIKKKLIGDGTDIETDYTYNSQSTNKKKNQMVIV